MADQLQAQQPETPRARADHQPAGVESGHAALVCAAQEVGGGQVTAPAGGPEGLEGPPLASQIDPQTGLSMGEVRCIDCFADDVEVLLAPWAAVRGTGELAFNCDRLGQRVVRFVEVFREVHPEGQGIGGAPKAFEHMQRRLSRDTIRPYIREIIAALDPAQAVFLASTLGEWLGANGRVIHRYELEVHVSVEGGGGPLVVGSTSMVLATLRYSSNVLPGWSRPLFCRRLEGGLGVGPTPVSANVAHPITTAEVMGDRYIAPSGVLPSETLAWQVSAAAVGVRNEFSRLTIETTAGQLAFDTSGLSAVVGTGSVAEASATLGVAECTPVGEANVASPKHASPDNQPMAR